MTVSLARRNASLVETLCARGVLTQANVTAAFLAVPRHIFLPGVSANEVYSDEAIPIKMQAGRAISSSSQPAMMAIMLEQLDLALGQSVLEIGAGSGYNAALLGQLVGSTGQVVSIDIDEDLVLAAREHLAAAGSANVQVICTDGVRGYPPGAPYDRILLTVGAGDIAPAWHDQLRPGGRLVLPQRLASGPQVSVAFDLAPAGVDPWFVSGSVRDCAFMPLRGAAAEPDVFTAVLRGLVVTTHGQPPATRSQIEAWLAAEPFQARSQVWANESEAFGGLSLWLSLHTANLVSFTIEGEAFHQGHWPSLFHFGSRAPMGYTVGLITTTGLALLGHGSSAAPRPVPKAEDELAAFELTVVAFGPERDRVAQELLDLLTGWDAAQRPTTSGLRLRVYSPDVPYQARAGEVVVPKRWSKLVVDWPAGPVSHT